ncbi:MAG TPA: hypothetical protein VF623_01510 [Segetibacter sp.]|jgi:hypothetical protein
MYKKFTLLLSVLLFGLGMFITSFTTYEKPDFKYEKIKQFIPEGYHIYDTASGDINGDGMRDYVLVLNSNTENANSKGDRPLIVLTGAAKGKFELLARNDNVVLCTTCGGIFGDPYNKISVEGQLIAIEHKVGGNYQWSRIITFKYKADTKEMVLNEDIIRSFEKSSPNNQKSIASNKNDFGVLPFTDYSYNKGF